MTEATPHLHWQNAHMLELSEVTFHLRFDERFSSRPDAFRLVKHRHMVERYIELVQRLAPARMVELGILQGGSVALSALLARPDRLLALDLTTEPARALEAFIDARGLRDQVRTRYGVDQADRARLREVVQQELGPEPLDLVVDDASHELEPTRASFDVLFPLLRDGGVFVIEDWSTIHHLDAGIAAIIREDPSARERLEAIARQAPRPPQPLTVLIFELVLAAAFRRDVVSEVVVVDDWAYAVRGPAVVDPDTFFLADLYGTTAAQLLPDG